MSQSVGGRIIMGIGALVGLTALALNVSDGKFYWHGHVTTLTNSPTTFWVFILVGGAVFLVFLMLAVFGVNFRKNRNRRR